MLSIETARMFRNIVRLSCSSLLIVCIFLVCIVMKLQGKLRNLPNSLKLTLVGIFLGAIAYFTVDSYILVNDTDFFHIQLGNIPKEFEICEALGNIIVLVTHWLFTSHYLKTACFLQ